MDLEDLIDKIDEIAKSEGSSSAGAFHNTAECSRSDLLDGQFYLFVPDDDLHKQIRKEIKNYVKQNRLHFVVTTQEHCEGESECHGHLVDPMKAREYRKYVFTDKFPGDISGASFYFFSKKDFQKYKKIANT